jgi:hypothetical protein
VLTSSNLTAKEEKERESSLGPVPYVNGIGRDFAYAAFGQNAVRTRCAMAGRAEKEQNKT